MAQQVQFRRGSSSDHLTFTGAVGEVTYDTTLKTLRVHDGSTAGGLPMINNVNPSFSGPLTLSTVGAYLQFPDGTKQYTSAAANFYMILPGSLYTPLSGTSRYYPGNGITISSVYANVSSPSTSGAISVDILVNSSVINTLTLAQGAYYTTLTTSNVVSSGSYVTVNVNSGNGSDLSLKFTYTNN